MGKDTKSNSLVVTNRKKDVYVVQSNDLIEAFYETDLSPTEHKLLRYSASKIKENPDSFPDVSFTINEFLDACGISSNAYHKRIDKFGDELSKKRIKVKNDKKIGWFPWVQAIVYDDGIINIKFNTLVKPLLLQLEGQFTKYNYKYIGDMRSSYTIRLFELLRQYALIGHRRIDIDTLREMLGVHDKYIRYSHFKERVLLQAKRELDNKRGLTFDFEEIKKGRKVTEIIFYIKAQESDIAKKYNPSSEESKYIKEARYLLEKYSIEISEDKLNKWSIYGIELLSNVLDEVKERKMEHPSAYIEKVLKAKFEKWQSLREGLIAESEPIKDLMASFIEKITQKNLGTNRVELWPDWFVKREFVSYMSTLLDKEQEQIEELWEMNGEYIDNVYRKPFNQPKKALFSQ